MDIYEILTFEDVRHAADLLRSRWFLQRGGLAPSRNDTEQTIAEAQRF